MKLLFLCLLSTDDGRDNNRESYYFSAQECGSEGNGSEGNNDLESPRFSNSDDNLLTNNTTEYEEVTGKSNIEHDSIF